MAGGVQRQAFIKLLRVHIAARLDDLKMPPRRINEIIHGKRAITADTALRLGRVLGTSAEMWMNLQNHYEMEIAKEKAGDIIGILKPLAKSA